MHAVSSPVSVLLPLLVWTGFPCTRPAGKPAEVSAGAKPVLNDSSDFKSWAENANRELEKAVLSGNFETVLKLYSDHAIVAPEFHPVVRGERSSPQPVSRSA